MALEHGSGNYIRGNWEPVLKPEDWKALVNEWTRRREGKTFSASGTRKHLLSGLLRCGRIREDGSMCSRSLTGAFVKRSYGREAGISARGRIRVAAAGLSASPGNWMR